MLAAPHAPMQETRPPTQQIYCIHPIILISFLYFKDNVYFELCALMRCRENPAPLLFSRRRDFRG